MLIAKHLYAQSIEDNNDDVAVDVADAAAGRRSQQDKHSTASV